MNNDDAIRDQLMKEFENKIDGREPTIRDSDLFEMFIVSSFHAIDDLSEVRSRSVELSEGNPGDGGFDGYFFAEDARTLILYQAKYSDSKHKLQSNELRQLCADAARLFHPNQHKDLDRTSWAGLKHAVDQCKESPSTHTVLLRFCYIGDPPSESMYQEFRDAAQNLFDPHGIAVQVEIFDSKEIVNESSDDDLSLETWTFQTSGMATDTLMSLKSSVPGLNDESYVSLLSGQSIAESVTKYGRRLFSKNIRHHLGAGKVNKGLQKALEEEAEMVWFGHNGITIVCDKFEIASMRDDGVQPKEITLQNPQIVNGCQSSSCLRHHYFSDAGNLLPEKEDVTITAKIVVMSSESTLEQQLDIPNRIAFAANSQSAVKAVDLCSNRQELVQLQRALRQRGVFFERKAKEWDSLPKDQKRLYQVQANRSGKSYCRFIDRGKFQQAFRAAELKKPNAAVVKKDEVWDLNESLFNDVFSADVLKRPDIAIFCTRAFNYLEMVYSFPKSKTQLPIIQIMDRRFDPSTAAGDARIKHIKSSKTLFVAHMLGLWAESIRFHKGVNSLFEIESDQIMTWADEIPHAISAKALSAKYVEDSNYRPFNRLQKVLVGTACSFMQQHIPTLYPSLYLLLKNPNAFDGMSGSMIEILGSQNEFASEDPSILDA